MESVQVDLPVCKGSITVPNYPVIVCLHGFMGGSDDWQPVIRSLPQQQQVNVLYLSLPVSFSEQVHDIETYSRCLWQELPPLQQPILLLAYSLGARIAMHWLRDYSSSICGALLEAGHPGLHGDMQRLQSDKQWQRRFQNQSITETLQQWYQQGVFKNQDSRQRAELIRQRYHGKAAALGDMLYTLSVAKQRNLSSDLGGHPIAYVTGECDTKYQAIAKQLVSQHTNIVHHIIAGAGHNCHSYQASPVGQILSQLLTKVLHEQPRI